MKRNRGFTLIELLVVVAIIALLVSILLPSLSRAKELAKRTVCALNGRNIYTAMQVYSEANSTWFPPMGSWNNNSPPTIGYGYGVTRPNDCTYAYYGNGHGQAACPPGFLVQQNLAPSMEMFYCPSQTNKSISLAGNKDSWNVPALTWGARMSYEWNPHYTPATSQTNWIESSLYKKTPIPQNKIAILDGFCSSTYVAHWNGSEPGWNVTWGGGGTRFMTSQKCYNLIVAQENAGQPPSRWWTAYEPILNVLETQ